MIFPSYIYNKLPAGTCIFLVLGRLLEVVMVAVVWHSRVCVYVNQSMFYFMSVHIEVILDKKQQQN